MAAVKYIAQRSLKAGVTRTDEISLDFAVTRLDRSTGVVGTHQITLSGDSESVRDRTDIFYSVTLKAQKEFSEAVDDYRQFLDSVDGGEQFTFDPYGTIAAPNLPLEVKLIGKGYKETRINDLYIAMSLKVRVASTTPVLKDTDLRWDIVNA